MSNNLDKYRDEVMTHLKYIKEKVDANHKHLLHLNGRVRSAEVAISWIKGIVAAMTTVFIAIAGWFKF